MENREISLEELFEFKQPSTSTQTSAVRDSYRTIDERLQLCQQCRLRSFDPASGLLCSLTNKKPDFMMRCEYFQIDESVQARMPEASPQAPAGFWGSWKPALLMSILGFGRAFLRAYSNEVDILSIVFMLLGIGWLVLVFTRRK